VRARHIERHFTGSQLVADIVIGMSDGLTVPFALAAGLTGAFASPAIVVTGGLAEIVAGAIAMGLGGYLAAKSYSDHYYSERKREAEEVIERPEDERREVQEVFRAYGLTDAQIDPILHAFQKQPEQWVNFMMRFELGIESPDPKRALSSAIAIACSYIVGGLIPLAPYMVLGDVRTGLNVSICITLIALLVFGYVKGRFTGTKPIKNAIQTMLIGGVAAAAAFLLAKVISHPWS
jgi:VIT1/CCC1 family predicted Fe2+/Mn2+ transporter